MKHWHNRFYSAEDSTERRFTWAAIAAAVIGAGGAIGSAYLSNQGDDDEYSIPPQEFKAAPEFPEAQGARENWWQTLQDWQKSGTYGANLPDYNAIYSNAANRINQYYWGGASGGGLIDKLKASAARRNVSGSPAMDVMSQRMGAEQAGQLKDLSTTVDTQKAQAVENARTNWLTSLMNLSGQRPSGSWSGGIPTGNSDLLPLAIGTGTSLVGNALNNYSLQQQQNQQNQNYMDWFSKLFGNQNQKQTPGSLTSSYSGNEFGVGWNNQSDLYNAMGRANPGYLY